MVEPGTPPGGKRLEILRRFADAGIRTGVLVAPILRGLTDDEDHPHRRGAGGVRRGRRLVRDGDPAPRPARDPRSLHAVDEAHLPVALPALCRAVRQACLRVEGVLEQVSERIHACGSGYGIAAREPRGGAGVTRCQAACPRGLSPQAASGGRGMGGQRRARRSHARRARCRGPPPGPQRTRTTLTWPAALQIGLPDHVADGTRVSAHRGRVATPDERKGGNRWVTSETLMTIESDHLRAVDDAPRGREANGAGRRGLDSGRRGATGSSGSSPTGTSPCVWSPRVATPCPRRSATWPRKPRSEFRVA